MRLYLKLLLLIALFLCALHAPVRQTAWDLAFETRVWFVCRFGSPADYEALIDDPEQTLAQEQGSPDVYRLGKQHRDLLAKRRAAAARLNVELSDEEYNRIAIEVFGKPSRFPEDDAEIEAALPHNDDP